MTPVITLEDLLREQLRDLYNAEIQLMDALPKMARHAVYERLKVAMENRLVMARGHVVRIERIARDLDFDASGKTCHVIRELIHDGIETARETTLPGVYDANLISAAQRMEHYELAEYNTARQFADVLGFPDVVDLLDAIIDEEHATDLALADICQDLLTQVSVVNSNVDVFLETPHAGPPPTLDPIVEEYNPDSGVGVGAAAVGFAAGALTGAAVGGVAGPVGVVIGTGVGATVGAVVAGFAGRVFSHDIDPISEHTYWRQNYYQRGYVLPDEEYEIYAPAYQYGWEAQRRHSGMTFDQVEKEIEKGWERSRGVSTLSWHRARHACRDGWDRVAGHSSVHSPADHHRPSF